MVVVWPPPAPAEPPGPSCSARAQMADMSAVPSALTPVSTAHSVSHPWQAGWVLFQVLPFMGSSRPSLRHTLHPFLKYSAFPEVEKESAFLYCLQVVLEGRSKDLFQLGANMFLQGRLPLLNKRVKRSQRHFPGTSYPYCYQEASIPAGPGWSPDGEQDPCCLAQLSPAQAHWDLCGISGIFLR